MSKYLTLLSISWQNGLVYKVSFLLWRFRQVVNTMLPLILWRAIFADSDSVVGYSQDQMIAYILISGMIMSLIMATALHSVPSTVYSGDLSEILVKPIGLFRHFLVTDIADKLKNFIFIVLEALIFWFILQPVVAMPELHVVAIVTVWILLGIGIHFWVELLFGSIGFWSPDVWGPKFLFFIFVELAAGRAFPLDILPQQFQNIFFMTPFPYFGFVQTQALLGRLPSEQFLTATLSMLGWFIALGVITKLVWARGLKDYAAAGR